MKSIGIGGRIAALLISLALLNSANAADYSLKSLGETEKKVREVVKKVLPATVGLRGAGPAVGTGVVVSKDGLILTAGHVAAATRDDITVSFPDGRKVKAKALGADYSRDSAMVQIIEEGEYPFVKVGKSDHLKVDDWCLALGHAGGFQIDRSPPVRLGRVVDRGGNLLLSTDCALIGGDSGGPLIDLEGNVIGIHSRIGQTLSQNHHVPISAFHYAWDRLKKGERWGTLDGGGRRRRGPRTGIRPAGGDDKGVRIRVQEDSHAAKAGLEDDDIVTKVDGKEVRGFRQFYGALRDVHKGVKLTILRGDEEKTIELKIVQTEEEKKAEEKRRQVREEVDKEFDKLVKDALANKSALEIPPALVEKAGGMMGLAQRMQRLGNDVKPKERAMLAGLREGPDVFFESIIKVFTKTQKQASPSVHSVTVGSKQIALGTAVSADMVLTKASEVEGKELQIVVEKKGLTAKVLQIFPDYDLAVLKVADAELTPIQWNAKASNPTLGSFVSAVGADAKPVAIGVLSVLSRNLSGSDKPYLGVALDNRDNGLLITSVQEKTAAEKAGLETGDIILNMDGKKYKSTQVFIDELLTHKPGDKVKLRISRDGDENDFEVTLGDRRLMPQRPDGTGRYPTGGDLSKHRRGYEQALQTDLPFAPNQCGSPLVDLQGRAIGLNISRAGRIKSYALPASILVKLIAQVDDEKTSDDKEDGEKKDAAKKDAAKKDAEKEAAKKDAEKEAAKKDAAKKDAEKEAAKKDAAKKDAEKKDAAKKDDK